MLLLIIAIKLPANAKRNILLKAMGAAGSINQDVFASLKTEYETKKGEGKTTRFMTQSQWQPGVASIEIENKVAQKN